MIFLKHKIVTDDKIIDVYLESEVEWVENDLDSEYGGSKSPLYPSLSGDIAWDMSLHSEEDNEFINQYVEQNFKELSELFIKKFIYKNGKI
jgi:hypothetical protein